MEFQEPDNNIYKIKEIFDKNNNAIQFISDFK